VKLDGAAGRVEVGRVLPQVGEVLQFEVKPGVALLFRAVAKVEGARCVVLTRWSGPPPETVPRAKSVFEVQPLQHHQWDRPMIGGWVSAEPPAGVRRVGKAKLRAGEAKRVMHPRDFVMASSRSAEMGQRVLPVASWESLMRDARAQWRWEHERAAVLAEDEARERAKLEAAVAELARMRGQ
jgi:hypothetical protein